MKASSVLDFYAPATWRRKVGEVMRRLLPANVLTALRDDDPDEMFADTLAFLRRVWAGNVEMLSQRVLSQFSHVRGFHGCRPLSIETYRKEGLVPLTRERLVDHAYELLNGRIARNQIAGRAATADLRSREGRIYFSAERDDFLDTCGHYLIRGPESLNCLFDGQLEPWCFELDRLRQEKGIPTLFECYVPIDSVVRQFREEMGRELVTRYFQLRTRRKMQEPWSTNWGFAISQPLPSELIRSHEHPREIRDPHGFGSFYANERERCDWCARRE